MKQTLTSKQFQKHLYCLSLSHRQVITHIATVLFQAHGLKLQDGEVHSESKSHFGISTYVEIDNDSQHDIEIYFDATPKEVTWSVIVGGESGGDKCIIMPTQVYVAATLQGKLDSLINAFVEMIGCVLCELLGKEKITQEATKIEMIYNSDHQLLNVESVQVSPMTFKSATITTTGGKKYSILIPSEGLEDFAANIKTHDLPYVSPISYGPFVDRRITH